MIKSGLGETTSPPPTFNFELTIYEDVGPGNVIDISLHTVIGDTQPSEVVSD
jgi:hypothetical protein